MREQNRLKDDIREVIRLSFPAILSQLTTIIMQYIDAAMVGSLGANASASIGLISSTTWLLGGIMISTTVGFSVQVAHYVGAREEKRARSVVLHGYSIGLVVSLSLTLIALLVRNHLPLWLGGDISIVKNSTLYFTIYALMLPFYQINSLSINYLQCSGDMVTPSILSTSMCFLDVIFNYFLIPRFGVTGAGMGTALALAIISMIMFSRLMFFNPILKINRNEKISFDSSIIKRAIRIGTPVGLQEIAMCSAQVVSTMIIAPLGPIAIAANSFAITVEGFCYMPGYGISQASSTVVGRSIGAKEYKRAKRLGYIAITLGALFMIGTGSIMYIICPYVFLLLTPDLAVRALATKVLRLGLLAEGFYGVSIVAAGALRGAADTFIPSILNLSSIWFIRIGLDLILVKFYGLEGVWIGMAIELTCRGLLLLIRFIKSPYFKKTPSN